MKSMITIPITLEQLISAIQQLQPSERTKIAKALIEVELQSDLKALITELYNQDPVDEVTDNDIMQEIQAVRQAKIK
jgi:ABC-type phosphate/phosphonate transport system substrate-binding protein